ncbi:MAG: class I tRNA ligase family protein [Lachnospiraceae bacterium]|nr:class I tRNA ligase family protein [Lachnospiraceae bacterium]
MSQHIKNYNYREIENKWEQSLSDAGTEDEGASETYYKCQCMPILQPQEISVADFRGRLLADVWARYRCMQGEDVLSLPDDVTMNQDAVQWIEPVIGRLECEGYLLWEKEEGENIYGTLLLEHYIDALKKDLSLVMIPESVANMQLDWLNRSDRIVLRNPREQIFLALQFLYGQGEGVRYRPVDFYVNGTTHATRRLILSRFLSKVLYDWNMVDFKEPFLEIVSVGNITGEDGKKMDFARGNAVNPVFLENDYGKDALRLYLLFVAPMRQDFAWDEDGLEGIYHFLTKLWNLVANGNDLSESVTKEQQELCREMTEVLSDRYLQYKFNTVVSGLMEYNNRMIRLAREGALEKATVECYLKFLAPCAPYLAQELWHMLGNESSLLHGLHQH